MAGQTTETVIDITKRFEWEVSRERIEECQVDKQIGSPVFNVKTDNVVSKWKIAMWPNWQKTTPEPGMIRAISQDLGIIAISLLSGDVSLKVEGEGIGVKTETGYMSAKPIKSWSGKNFSKIVDFNGRSKSKERTMYANAGSREDFLKLIKNNKITVVATLRFYMDRNDYIKKGEIEQIFLSQIRSISSLDPLADFTIICGDREFKCIRAILASRSTVFKAMLLNDRFVEKRENSVTIENASPDNVEDMLEFISKGIVPQDIREKAIDLIDLADRYDLQDLIEICEDSLANNLTTESVIETLIAIDLHVPNSRRRQKILDFIKAKAAEVVKSSHWKEFMAKYPDLVTEIFLWAALAGRCFSCSLVELFLL